jgi:hypothetical protein
MFESESVEKWNAFIELCFGRSEIRKYYFMKFRSSMLTHFSKNIIIPWDFVSINEEEYRWFINDYKQDSIVLFWDVNRLYLRCNPSLVKVVEANDLLKTPEYAPIISCFDSCDVIGYGGQREYLYGETHRYKFNETEFIQRTDNEQGHLELSWYAGNKTDELIKQITDKVNRFRTPEITKLMVDLNEKCKR